MKTTPLVKGLITGLLLVGITYFFTVSGKYDNVAPYIVYAIYAAGICWTIFDYAKTPGYTGKFGDIFGQAFRCFIIVTIVMVVYTFIYGTTHPELAKQGMDAYRTALLKDKNRTAAEVEAEIVKVGKNYVLAQVYVTVFATLILGAFFSLMATAILIMRRKK